MPALVLVLLALVVLVAAVAHHQAKARRREALARFGAARGLTFSAGDPHGLDDLDFKLFRQGDGRGVENVLTGRWEGLPVHAADYWYYDETTDSEGRTSRSYRHFSVVVADIEAFLPRVCIEQESFLSRVSDHLGFRDVEFESEEFNQRFQVHGDREFAFKLLDARMITWLLSTGRSFGFEVNGRHLLVWAKRLDPERLVPLLMVTASFVGAIPRLVWNEYGTAGSTS